jgi:hypothetical protein
VIGSTSYTGTGRITSRKMMRSLGPLRTQADFVNGYS